MTCYVLLGALALLLASMCGNAMLQTDAKNMMKIPNLGSKTTAKQIVDACGEGKYLKGKTAIVTGGNSGIGLETCKALASAGAKVILCSRDIKVGYEAIQGEIQEKGHGGYVVRDTSNIFVKQLDLSSLASVKSFSEDILATEERIDFLVLNAGIMALPTRETTEVGFEKQLGVNHFGHMLLTSILFPKLNSVRSPSRVVVLSSTAHTFGEIDVNDLHFSKRMYLPWTAYGQSKLANLIFAKWLADKFSAIKSQSTAVAVHPGVVQTDLWRSTPMADGILGMVLSFFIADKSIPQGAATSVYACLSPRAVESDHRGAYLMDCGPAAPSKAACDPALREAFMGESEKQLDDAMRSLGLY